MPRRNERGRLAERYGDMTDSELAEVAQNAFSLTDVAREVLTHEIARRKLAVEIQTMHPEPVPPPKLVVVRVFRDLPEAMLAKSVLNSAGIRCVLDDTNTIGMNWFWSNAIGGVKLRVSQEDAAAANELLNQAPPESFDAGSAGEFTQPRCPSCGSLEVSFQELVKPIAGLSLYIGLPAPVHRTGWNCRMCGHRWDESPQDSDEKA
jgi:Putative prokaryotic signal transducing protein